MDIRNAAEREENDDIVLQALSKTEWLSSVQVAIRVGMDRELAVTYLHRLSNTFEIEVKNGRTINGGSGYLWRRR